MRENEINIGALVGFPSGRMLLFKYDSRAWEYCLNYLDKLPWDSDCSSAEQLKFAEMRKNAVIRKFYSSLDKDEFEIENFFTFKRVVVNPEAEEFGGAEEFKGVEYIELPILSFILPKTMAAEKGE